MHVRHPAIEQRWWTPDNILSANSTVKQVLQEHLKFLKFLLHGCRCCVCVFFSVKLTYLSLTNLLSLSMLFN